MPPKSMRSGRVVRRAPRPTGQAKLRVAAASPGHPRESYGRHPFGPVEIVMIQDAGHYPHAQFLTQTAAAVRGFLKRTICA